MFKNNMYLNLNFLLIDTKCMSDARGAHEMHVRRIVEANFIEYN